MTLRQKRFVEEYLLTGNAAKAARDSGYSRKTAEQAGWRLLRNVEVSAAIAEGRAIEAKKADLSRQSILERYRRIADVCLNDILDFDGEHLTCKSFEEVPREIHPAIESIKEIETKEGRRFEVKLRDALHALDSLAKMLGFLDERSRVAVEVQQVVIHEEPKSEHGAPSGSPRSLLPRHG